MINPPDAAVGKAHPTFVIRFTRWRDTATTRYVPAEAADSEVGASWAVR
jgi:hypothetical protein